MSSLTVPKPWRVADVNFIGLFTKSPTDRQMCIEFANGIRPVVADSKQIPLAAANLPPHDEEWRGRVYSTYPLCSWN